MQNILFLFYVNTKKMEGSITNLEINYNICVYF